MNVDIHCKGMSLTEAIRTHVEDKLSKLDRILPGDANITVFLDCTNGNPNEPFSAEVSFRVWGNDLVSKTQGEDLYAAVTQVADHILLQVKRLKDKRNDKRKGGASIKDYQEPPVVYREEDEYEDEYQTSLKAAEAKEAALAAELATKS